MTSERKKTKSFAAFGSVVALGAAAVAAAVLVAATASDPLDALRAFFLTPLGSRWFLGNTLDSAALLTVAALGIVIAFRAGTFNLGGEGQIYAGGLAASVVLLSYPNANGTIVLCAAALAGALTGGILAGTSGLLKARFGVDELISSFLVSSAVGPIADYLISGPLRDSANNLLATARFAPDRLLPRILEPSTLSISVVFALILIAAVALVLDRTALGFRIRVAGSSPKFAAFAGIDPTKYWTPAFSLSGALHGLAGFFAVAGTYGLCHRGFSGGIGWGAIAVALIGRNSPIALIPAALAYAWLETGSETAMLSSELSFETASLVQAAVFLLVTARFSGWNLSRVRAFLRRNR
ncbi:MAG: ABC transporter permease [Treponemataceae bacterium]